MIPFSGGPVQFDFGCATVVPEDASGPGLSVQHVTDVGTTTIDWYDCEKGILIHDIPSLGLSGRIDIERVALDNVALCQALWRSPQSSNRTVAPGHPGRWLTPDRNLLPSFVRVRYARC